MCRAGIAVEEDKTPDEHPDITQRVMAKMAAEHCLPGENGIVCQVVLLCSRAPDIAGESLPDGTEIGAARAAMENAGSDLKRLAIASDMNKTASDNFQEAARVSVANCEAKVRAE